MSPIDKEGNAKVIRDADSFFRDHRGLLAMGHLIAMIAAVIGVMFAVTSIFGFIVRYDDWPTMGQYGVALLMAGAGLEYGQTNLESKQR